MGSSAAVAGARVWLVSPDTQAVRSTEGATAVDGTFVLQGIVMPDRRYAHYLRSVDFIQRYIFPGGCLPSVTALCEAMTADSDLRLVHLEEMSDHYAETLRRWRARAERRWR